MSFTPESSPVICAGTLSLKSIGDLLNKHGLLHALQERVALTDPAPTDSIASFCGFGRAFERDTHCVARSGTTPFHRDGCEGGAEHVSGCKDIVGRGPEILIGHDSATRVDLYARGIDRKLL